jgi:hypothetical protein
MARRKSDLADAETEARAEAERAVAPRSEVATIATGDRAQAADQAPDVGESGTDRTAVTARSFTLTGGGVGSVDARDVTVTRGGIGRAQASDIAVSQGGVALARADRVFVELGGIGGALGGEVSVTQGYLRSTLAREVRLDQAFARTVVTGNATFGPRSGAFLVVAGRVEGSVRPLLDWRGGLAFGAAFGLVAGLVRSRRARTMR